MRTKIQPTSPRIQVRVKEEQISHAIEGDSTRCMIAEAIKAQFPAATSVAVDLATIRFTDPEKNLRYVYLTPYRAQVKLLEFDEGTRPEPFNFLLQGAHVTAARLSEKARARGHRYREKKKHGSDNTSATPDESLTPDESSEIPASVAPPIPTKRQLHDTGDGNRLPVVVGGKRPPQLKILRQFGIRAFRAARNNRRAEAADIEQPRNDEEANL